MRQVLVALLLAAPLLVHARCGQIAHADVIGRASAALPFAQQSGYGAQVYGKHLRASAIPEDGIQGPALPNGDTLRFGKAGKALLFQLDPSDPVTSRSKRSEISFEPNIEPDKVYWIAFSVYLEDWGRLHPQDAALFGTQLHSGDNSLHLSPAFSLYTAGEGRRFKVQARWSTSPTPSRQNTVTANYAERPLPFNRWIDFVFRFRLSTANAGLLQVWMDGERIADHRGNLGFHTPAHRDYVKFGYYNWSPVMSSPRKVLLRSPTIVADPSGETYRVEQLRAFIGC
ncbi:MAG TPA: heparin lyase I family protein [Burkholderiales bacterium]